MTYHVFDIHAEAYDAWYDTEVGKAIFAMEVACLRPFLHSYPYHHEQPVDSFIESAGFVAIESRKR